MDDETRKKFKQELENMIKDATEKEQAARDLQQQADQMRDMMEMLSERGSSSRSRRNKGEAADMETQIMQAAQAVVSSRLRLQNGRSRDAARPLTLRQAEERFRGSKRATIARIVKKLEAANSISVEDLPNSKFQIAPSWRELKSHTNRNRATQGLLKKQSP
ncbi:hypothetical protein FLAG1_09897 [Fusarium langsethiae]|uniref:Uncharacterized protein n=1 Tax=Fusarium langsethiae TaxID=179993 RepID=A0A0M9EQ36_FUSLA|nr:hypothetical protein FLAG1_09897 [Fusarium langsethiae]